MFRLLFVYVLGCCAVGSYAGKVSFITPCKTYKEQDKACLLASAQAALPHLTAGISELGVPSSDPLNLGEGKLDDANLKLTFTDTVVTRLKECKFTDIEYTDEHVLAFSLECPILATGKYNIDGKLLFVPIQGSGGFEIKTEKIKLIAKVFIDLVEGTDGKKYVHITSMEKSYEPQEQVFFHLENLFNGDEEKAKAIQTILNHSWKELIVDIGKPIVDDVIEKIKERIEKFFESVPADELFLA